MHRYTTEVRGWIMRCGFRALALLWLPIGIMPQAAVRFMPAAGLPGEPLPWPEARAAGTSLVLFAACRLHYRRAAQVTGIGLGAATVAASLVAGLLGPVTIAVYEIVLSLPVWGTWW